MSEYLLKSDVIAYYHDCPSILDVLYGDKIPTHHIPDPSLAVDGKPLKLDCQCVGITTYNCKYPDCMAGKATAPESGNSKLDNSPYMQKLRMDTEPLLDACGGISDTARGNSKLLEMIDMWYLCEREVFKDGLLYDALREIARLLAERGIK